MNHKEEAKKVVDAIKAYISQQKKCYPNLNMYDVDIRYYNCVCGNKSGIHININHKDVTEILDKYDFIYTIKEINALLEELKNEKGWNGIDLDEKEIYLPNSLKTISVPYVKLFNEPCKEFVKLAKYLEKHCGKLIGMKDLYRVCIGGKRGRIYGEDSSREYLAYNPSQCESILKDLRLAKGTRDIATASDIKTIDDIDDFDLQASIRYETEFNGLRYTECVVKVETPNGKIKKNIRVAI